MYEFTTEHQGIVAVDFNQCFGKVVVDRFWGVEQEGGNDKVFADQNIQNNSVEWTGKYKFSIPKPGKYYFDVKKLD